MRSRVAVDLKSLRIFRRENLYLGVGFERAGQIIEFSVDTCDNGVRGKTWAD